jgi:hypothetical protein
MEIKQNTSFTLYYYIVDSSGNPRTGLTQSDVHIYFKRATDDSFTEYTTGFSEVGLGVYKVLYYDQYYVSAVLGPLITVIAPVTSGAFLQSVREDEVVDELTTVRLNNLKTELDAAVLMKCKLLKIL